MNNDKLLQAEH